MKLVIISGPSGSGKTSILNTIIEKVPSMFEEVISCTTRDPRIGEVDGKDYHFLFEDEFANETFLETDEYAGNFYGTRLSDVQSIIDKGKIPVTIVTIPGKEAIEKSFPDTVSIFIMPPSVDVLRERLFGRGTEDDAIIQTRMNKALDEMKKVDTYDHSVVNDNLRFAAGQVLGAIL